MSATSIRRVSRKLIKTTKVYVNPRNTRLDREGLKQTVVARARRSALLGIRANREEQREGASTNGRPTYAEHGCRP